ncbi:FAD-dependent monooxygenase [Salinispirillum marinum]|uniref:FAD-dependent monooxygenase n=2 Tax=Saccharospirillaceae TaxID=255527 RepID=A0ABV8B9R2_9GAMM
MNSSYDIIIIGGGMVGMAFVLSLPSALQAKTLLIDTAEQPDNASPSPSFDDRGTALSQTSLTLLDRLGVRSALEPHLGYMTHIEVSQQGYWGITHLQQDDPFGAVINNRQLGYALWQQARQSAVHWRFATGVTALSPTADFTTVHCTDQQAYRAKLVILADGGRSGLARQMGIGEFRHAYGQSAIVFNIDREQPVNGRAYERFAADGPRALLPLSGRRQTVVWTVDTPQLNEWLNEDDTSWRHTITDCFGSDQGAVSAVSARQHYPLQWRRSHETVRHRLALIGNSALSLHPVAGQGFNLHLRGLTALASHLAQAFNDDQDVGQLPHLRAWQAQIRADQRLIEAACHGLVSAFALHHPMIAHARGLALAGLDSLPALKSFIARTAIGSPT